MKTKTLEQALSLYVIGASIAVFAVLGVIAGLS